MSGAASAPVLPSEAVRRAAEALTIWWQGHLEAITDGALNGAIGADLSLLDGLCSSLEEIQATATARAKARG